MACYSGEVLRVHRRFMPRAGNAFQNPVLAILLRACCGCSLTNASCSAGPVFWVPGSCT